MLYFSRTCISFPSCYRVKWKPASRAYPSTLFWHSLNFSVYTTFLSESYFSLQSEDKRPLVMISKDPNRVVVSLPGSLQFSLHQPQGGSNKTLGHHLGGTWGHIFLFLCVSFLLLLAAREHGRMNTLLPGAPASRQSWVLSLDPQFMSLSIPLQLSGGFAAWRGKQCLLRRRWLLQPCDCHLGPLGIHPSVKLVEGRNVSANSVRSVPYNRCLDCQVGEVV